MELIKIVHRRDALDSDQGSVSLRRLESLWLLGSVGCLRRDRQP